MIAASKGNVTYRNSRTANTSLNSDLTYEFEHTITKTQYDQLRTSRRAVGMAARDGEGISQGSSC